VKVPRGGSQRRSIHSGAKFDSETDRSADFPGDRSGARGEQASRVASGRAAAELLFASWVSVLIVAFGIAAFAGAAVAVAHGRILKADVHALGEALLVIALVIIGLLLVLGHWSWRVGEALSSRNGRRDRGWSSVSR
jgi:hypothetical protein